MQTRWNFNIRTVNTVYEHRDNLITCIEKIADTPYQTTIINHATGIKRLLSDENFIFWVTIFHNIMPHIDCLYNSVQSKNTEPVQINNSVNIFIKEIKKIRNNMSMICLNVSKDSDMIYSMKRKTTEDTKTTKKHNAIEVCDILITQTIDRLSFSKHLTGALLLKNEKYKIFNVKFSIDYLQTTIDCYPFFF